MLSIAAQLNYPGDSTLDRLPAEPLMRMLTGKVVMIQEQVSETFVMKQDETFRLVHETSLKSRETFGVFRNETNGSSVRQMRFL